MIDPISQTMNAAAAGMRAQSQRLSVASENLSNADTHGYKRKTLSFTEQMDGTNGTSTVGVSRPQLDRSQGEMIFDPNHPLANEQGMVESSNVDMIIEMADAREANRSFEANLTTFKQAGEMYRGLLGLLR
ncbi:flagellar basal body rod C-terminal domain-containing protein [uncultured Algimonas sp.]|uniref:flagellar basal body rod C-terminal domain-containing protein n=1 Tax=uncultured Algimonas sp. TaxID=1547920 RepID=UPI00262C1764|nr:flagellar basal body rod C-terminal domain-containing protein [uncultured Algimonas sp.]